MRYLESGVERCSKDESSFLWLINCDFVMLARRLECSEVPGFVVYWKRLLAIRGIKTSNTKDSIFQSELSVSTKSLRGISLRLGTIGIVHSGVQYVPHFLSAGDERK